MEFLLKQVDQLKQYLPDVRLHFDWKNATKIAGGVLVTVTILYCGKIWYAQRFFKRRGIRTPKYNMLSGNYGEVVKNGYSNQLRDWSQKFGKVYGIYEGHNPILVTSDPDFIQEVFIKQYGNFMARKRQPLQISDSGPECDVFLSAKGQWKRMRNIINPTFSSAKLKEMMPLMKMCTDRLIAELNKYDGKEINVKTYLNRFTMDMICNCAFGMDIDCLKNPTNKFLEYSNKFFDSATATPPALLFLAYFPELKRLAFVFLIFMTSVLGRIDERFAHPFFWLKNRIGAIIEFRQKNRIDRKDFVKLMLECLSDENTQQFDESKSDFAQTKYEKKMNLDEIKLNLFTFMLAGYDTTSNTMTYCSYILAKHPEELAKLQSEIDGKFHVESQIEPDYDNVSELPYLDMFIKETLRMYPLGNIAINRRCINECVVKGMTIPEGLTIACDALGLHYDPEHWGPTDPKIFYPLRFSPEIKRHPCVYMPFGLGPRNCVGMKFALLEIKLTLAKILLNFDIVASPNTPKDLELEEGFSVRRPKHGVNVIFRKRNV